MTRQCNIALIVSERHISVEMDSVILVGPAQTSCGMVKKAPVSGDVEPQNTVGE